MSSNDDEGTYRYLVNKGHKPLWRRVRKSRGETWQPNTSLLDARDLGMICKVCHKRIRYKDFDCVYEYRTDAVFRTWFCSYCGQAVKEDNMTELAEYYIWREETTIVLKGGEHEES